MKAQIIALLFLTFLSECAVMAQQPAPEQIVTVNASLDQAIDAQMKVFKDGGRPEVLRLSDALIYPFGIYQPVLTCTVLRACIVELESGEQLISMIAGDDQRWLIDPTATGKGANTPLVSVKPTTYNITTNLVLSTDRRIYHLTLDSPPKGKNKNGFNPLSPYTRHIRFYYPETGVRTVNADIAPEEQENNAKMGAPLTRLNYAYKWERDKRFPWEPEVVFDDGERVYIKPPQEAGHSGQPVLTVGPKGEEQVANYAFREGFFIIEGLFDYARLVVSRTSKKRLFRPSRQVQHSLSIFPK